MLYKQELWISEHTKKIGRQLLRELNIHMGYGIAEFLAVNNCYDNQQAFLVWLDQQLTQHPEGVEIEQIKKNFFEHFPESYCSLC